VREAYEWTGVLASERGGQEMVCFQSIQRVGTPAYSPWIREVEARLHDVAAASCR
jgi:hypothetical protein